MYFKGTSGKLFYVTEVLERASCPSMFLASLSYKTSINTSDLVFLILYLYILRRITQNIFILNRVELHIINKAKTVF